MRFPLLEKLVANRRASLDLKRNLVWSRASSLRFRFRKSRRHLRNFKVRTKEAMCQYCVPTIGNSQRKLL